MATDYSAENDAVHSAVAEAVRTMRGEMLANVVVIGITVNDEGQRTLSCWTSPDQRLWETIGMVEFVRMDHGAHLAERRIVTDD